LGLEGCNGTRDREEQMIVIGVDTGGTLTDIVIRQGKRWLVHKVLSTPLNPAAAVLGGLRHVAGNQNKRIIYGTTVAKLYWKERAPILLGVVI
jgi:N-acetylglucosamine kinase-like BadF-type ATPase